jgi:hypothetical protein
LNASGELTLIFKTWNSKRPYTKSFTSKCHGPSVRSSNSRLLLDAAVSKILTSTEITCAVPAATADTTLYVQLDAAASDVPVPANDHDFPLMLTLYARLLEEKDIAMEYPAWRYVW